MKRAFILCGLLAVSGCKTKAQKQAEISAGDLGKAVKLVSERHVDALSRALPAAAEQLSAKVTTDVRTDAETLGTAFVTLRDKNDDLRSSKRSYFVLADIEGDIVWIDDPGWKIVGRKLALGFPAVKEALDGKKYSTGSGKFGGASEEALTFVEASPITKGGKTVGVLVAGWEAHEGAEDVQRQLAVQLAQQNAPAKVRIKAKDKLQMAIDMPELYVAVFKGKYIYMQEDAPQPVVQSLEALDLLGKTANGAWQGTFDVQNRGWGGAAQRLPALGADVGIAVVRFDP
ncbi:MAG: hypothetical protein ACXVEF_07125 [Polyangiales bacterium]